MDWKPEQVMSLVKKEPMELIDGTGGGTGGGGYLAVNDGGSGNGSVGGNGTSYSGGGAGRTS